MEQEGFLQTHVIPCVGMCSALLAGVLVPRIRDPERKKWVSSLVGFTGYLVVGGPWLTLHLVLLVAVNSVVIVRGNKRSCFVKSFYLSFAISCVFSLEIDYLPRLAANFHRLFIFMMVKVFQMIHLAGEVQDAFLANQKLNKLPTDSRKKVYTQVSHADVFHFAFCFLGLVTMFTYRTYYDWLHYSFYLHSDRFEQLVERAKTLAKIMIYLGLTTLVFPYDFIMWTDDFYYFPFLYRLLIATYSGIGTYLKLFAFFLAGDLYCILSGLGAYPSATNPKPGRGPTQRLELLDQIAADPRLAQLEKYNYETIRNIYLAETLTAPTFRVFWKKYNVCAQYVLVENVYKRFPYPKFRVLATFLVSGVWHGLYATRLVSVLCFLVYLKAEDILHELFAETDSTGPRAKIVATLFWASYLFGNSYMFFAVNNLTSVHHFFKFFFSIWFIPLLYPFVLLAISLVLLSLRNADVKPIRKQM